MNNEEKITPTIFRVSIDGMKNYEWQGSVYFEGNEDAQFESLIELIDLVEHKLGAQS